MKCNTGARSRNNCCHGNAINITYSEYVSVALFIERAKSIRCILSSSVACPAATYFFTLSQKRHGFWKNVIENKLCILIYFTVCLKHFPL
jgi:hypothetical protein